MESYCRSQQEQMPDRNGVLTARFDKFCLQCHSKQAAVITHPPPPPSHPAQSRTHFSPTPNPTSSSVLLFKLLQAANSLRLNLWQLLPSHLESWWGRGPHEDEFSELKELTGGGGANTGPGNVPQMGYSGKQGFAGPPQHLASPPLYSRSSHSPRPAPELASMQSSPLRSTHPL